MRTPRIIDRRLAVVALAPTLLALLTACGGSSADVVGGTADPVGAGSATTTSASTGDAGAATTDPAPSTSARASTTTASTTKASTTTASRTTAAGSGGGASDPGAAGCHAGGAAIPAGADLAKAGDLDGDGKADTIWMVDRNGKRYLGVETASGARFSTVYNNAAPQTAEAVGDTLGDGTAVVLLDTKRSAELYAVIGCELVATKNKDGEQYTFDEGFTGFGSGAGCPKIGEGKVLVGYNKTPVGKGSDVKISRTTITIGQHGVSATNGTTTQLGTFAAHSATADLAGTVTCGVSKAAGEPQS